MTQEHLEQLAVDKASLYKHYQEIQGTKDPIVLRSVADAYFMGFINGYEKAIEDAAEWLLHNDSYSKPTEVLVRDMKQALL